MKYAKLIFLLLIFDYSTTQALKYNWYLKAIQQTSLSYKSKCTLINAFQHIKKISLLTNSLISNLSYQEIKEEINQKKLTIKNRYIQKKEQLLNNLGDRLNFTPQQWNHCLQTIHTSKQLTIEQSNVFHDPTIPTELMTLIKMLLVKNNIDPLSVSLAMDTTNNSNLLASTITSLKYTYDSEHEQFMQNSHLTQKIIFYTHITNKTYATQLAICAHEIEHLLLQHGTIITIIEQYIQHYKKNSLIFKETTEYQQLKIIDEEQAEIFAALKDPKVAQALVDLRATQFYPDHLYEAHYNDLVEINNLWKVEKLICPISVHSTIST